MSALQEALCGLLLIGSMLIVFPVCIFTGEIIKNYYLKGDHKNDMARRSRRNPRG